ncbi:polyprenyl synthetase family protein [Candidatus Bathyarchaeota archaeon]|nr:polyprenyl synthetase family protein [Candidatus Bathyarchaeota archaeon]
MKEKKSVTEETGEKLLEKVRRLCENEGLEGWKLAQKTMLKEKADSPKLQEIIEYMMLKYKPDYFRPALLSFCCKAVGGNPKTTIPTGAALTLFAWAIGIHDDIIDRSRMKNKHPTVLGKFGKDLALILSDVLFFKGFTLLRKTLDSEISVGRLVEILETIEKIWFEQSAGETLEIQSRGSTDVTSKACLEKIRMRASEMEACTRIGGILGDGSRKQIEDLGAYGRLVGMMSILRNELIDMLEFNMLRHRIRRESLPLPIIYALQDQRIRPQLISLITKSKLTKRDLRNISKLSDRSGGIEYIANLIDRMAQESCAYAKSFRSKELKIIGTSSLISSKEWRPLLSN